MQNNSVNDSLKLISATYDTSDSDSDSQSTAAEGFQERQSESFSSDLNSFDASGSDENTDSDSDLESTISRKPSFIPKQIKVKGELGVKDLPPIEDLHISVREEECIPFAKVYSIVDTLLVTQSLPDKPALNIDSVFFRHNGIPIGQIFDVFGPVKRPFYSVRFNTNKEIHEKGLQLDMVLYAAPQTKHTQYVFAKQLMQVKGSDASWVNDCEPPLEYLDYSDDEQERNNNRKQKKQLTASQQIKQEKHDDGPAVSKKYRSYEEHMNRNNTIRNKYYDRKINYYGGKSGWDVGWHKRIDGFHSAADRSVNSPWNGTFQMRPPLFNPPSCREPPALRSTVPLQFRQQPGWADKPTVLPHQTFPTHFSSEHSSIHMSSSLGPHVSNMLTSPPSSFFCQQPSIMALQSIPIPPRFPSSPSGSNQFYKFPQLPSGTTM